MANGERRAKFRNLFQKKTPPSNSDQEIERSKLEPEDKGELVGTTCKEQDNENEPTRGKLASSQSSQICNKDEIIPRNNKNDARKHKKKKDKRNRTPKPGWNLKQDPDYKYFADFIRRNSLETNNERLSRRESFNGDDLNLRSTNHAVRNLINKDSPLPLLDTKYDQNFGAFSMKKSLQKDMDKYLNKSKQSSPSPLWNNTREDYYNVYKTMYNIHNNRYPDDSFTRSARSVKFASDTKAVDESTPTRRLKRTVNK